MNVLDNDGHKTERGLGILGSINTKAAIMFSIVCSKAARGKT